ncbi:hypothetical protein IKG54_01070 [Candidatus Saccharibacteria bacterium]|nr:hypothetical protein [Candidatus Saccharibacteria bacterium]
MRNKFVLFGLVLTSVIFLHSGTVAASSNRTEWGNRDISYEGSGNDPAYHYHRSLSGATWYYYSLQDYPITSPDETMSVPFGDAYTEKVSVPVNTCKPYGGFWALLRNGYKMEDGKVTLTDPVAAIKMSDLYGGTTNSIVYKDRLGEQPSEKSEASAYGTMTEVETLFRALSGTTAIPDGMNWDNNSDLSYFCSGETSPNIPSDEILNFVSFSTVSLNEKYESTPIVNEQSNLSNAFTVPAGSTVSITFHHYIAKSHEQQLGAGIIHYTVEGYTINGQNDSDNEEGNIPTDTLTKQMPVDKTNYYVNESEIITRIENVQINSEVTYCQRIKVNDRDPKAYSLSNFSIINDGEESTSSACIVIKPIASTGVSVTSCTQGDDNGGIKSNYMDNSVLGNTAATVGLALNGDLKTTHAAGEPDSISRFARPGDVVQFSYALCFGAHGVKNPSNDKTITVKPGINNPIINSFAVVVGNGIVADRQASFLFGRANDVLGDMIYVNNDHARSGQLNGGSLYTNYDPSSTIDTKYLDLPTGSPEVIFASPDNKEKTAGGEDSYQYYDCAAYSDLKYGRNISTGGYQIPGFQESKEDCQSSLLRKINDDGSFGNNIPSVVGMTISQSLVYKYIAAWPQFLDGANMVSSEVGRLDFERIRGLPEDYNSAYEFYNRGHRTSSGKGVFSTKDVIKTANVVIPYNFDTNISAGMESENSNTVYPGEEVTISANVDIIPRSNPLVESSKDANGKYAPYATITPPNTKVELIKLLIPDWVELGKTYTYPGEDSDGKEYTLQQILNGEGQPFHKQTICNYFRYYFGDDYGECMSEVVKGRSASEGNDGIGNKDSNPAGEEEYYHEENLKRVVPDVEAGYKYCTLIGINHGDSHGVSGEELSAYPYLDDEGNETYEANSGRVDDNGNPIRNKDNPRYAANRYSVNTKAENYVVESWKLSKATCRTITKKPNFQVWNGGVYSGGSVTSLVADKSVNTKLATDKPTGDKDKRRRAASSSYFGSWAEYFVVSKGTVNGFASASALGYTDPFEWSSLGENSQKIPHTEHFAAKGIRGNDFCELSRLTISNIDCEEKNSAGDYAAGDTDNTFLEDYKQRILNHYTRAEASIPDPGVILGGEQVEESFTYGKQNGADYLKVLGNYHIGDYPIVRESGVLVIEVEGRLTIDQNICLGENGICQNGSSSEWGDGYLQNVNELSLNKDNGLSFGGDTFSDIPQVILIAESISIGSEVSQIDAWLITNSRKDNYDGGYINTCKEFENGKTGANVCWKTLKINGPVITSALLLNRTGGAWPGFSGDVGNPAYDILAEELERYIKNSTVRETFKLAAEKLCELNLTPDCIEKRINSLAKEYFLDNITPEDKDKVGFDESKLPERRAYEYSRNYSADKKSVAANNAYTRDLTCDGSITPAEIFDLHPLVYYWALAESQKTHQAVITYAQEFAPRY